MSTIQTNNPDPQPAPAPLSVEQQQAILQHRIARAANWWYWIAALSLVNTGAFLMHSEWRFVLGTGVVDVLNAIAIDHPSITTGVLVTDVIIIGVIALWGWLCTKGMRWAFWTGLILYAFDLLVEALAQQWISVAFHAYAIFMIYQGVTAINLMRKLNSAVQAQQPYYMQAAGTDEPSRQPPEGYPGVDPNSELGTTAPNSRESDSGPVSR